MPFCRPPPRDLKPWLARFVALEMQVREKAPPDPAVLDASQNARNLLRSFFLLPSGVAEHGPKRLSGVPAPA